MNDPRTVIVTGAGGGIGRAIVACLATTGATVIAGDLGPGNHPGTQVHETILDVLDDRSVADAIALATGLGHVAGIVNCAGVLLETPVDDVDGSGVEAMLAVNLLGAMRVVRFAAPHLRTGTAIVNISSIAASGGSAPSVSGYAASKGGLEAYTRAMACELGPRGIRVNAVAPGFIRAPMAHLLLDTPGGEDRLVRRVPLGRLGEPVDIANVVAFLLSDRAAYVTGTVMTVDGGIRAT